MMLPNGQYRTKAGSRLTVSGAHGGIFTLKFDWIEECGCIDCQADPVPQDGRIVWRCKVCGGGSAAILQECNTTGGR